MGGSIFKLFVQKKRVSCIGRVALFAGLILSVLFLLSSMCSAVELGMMYDANGNLVTGDEKFRVYNSLNQLSAIYNGTNSSGTLLESYDYHPTEERILGKRVYNSTGAVIETTIYFSKTFVKVINSSGDFDFTYVYQNGQLVAQRNPDGTKIFIHTDAKGSSTVVTNSIGAVIENSSYDPFGSTLSGNIRTRYGYEAKESDSLVGDTNFNFRKYLSQYGMFAQPDTLIQNVFDPQSLNRYSFERNNPYGKKDETGHADKAPSFEIGTSLYNLAQGHIISAGYSRLAEQSFKQGDYSGAAHYMGTAYSITADTIINSITIFIGGTSAVYESNNDNSVDFSKPKSILDKALSAPTESDYETIDRHFEPLRDDLKNEKDKLDKKEVNGGRIKGSGGKTIIFDPEDINHAGEEGSNYLKIYRAKTGKTDIYRLVIPVRTTSAPKSTKPSPKAM